MMKNERFENTEQKPDVIAGRNPVSEAVRSNRPIDNSSGYCRICGGKGLFNG